MIREEILKEALETVSARGDVYGPPEENFQNIADLWKAYWGAPISAHDVAVMMMLVKVARLMKSPYHHDSWVDICGYAALGGEVTAN